MSPHLATEQAVSSKSAVTPCGCDPAHERKHDSDFGFGWLEQSMKHLLKAIASSFTLQVFQVSQQSSPLHLKHGSDSDEGPHCCVRIGLGAAPRQVSQSPLAAPALHVDQPSLRFLPVSPSGMGHWSSHSASKSPMESTEQVLAHCK